MSFKKHFILFLFICSILPISLLGILLLKESANKFDERFNNLQNVAILYSQEHFHKDLENLELFADQIAYLKFNKQLIDYFQNKKTHKFAELIKDIKKDQHLDKIAFIDTKKNVLYTTDDYVELNLEKELNPAVNKLLELAFEGKSLSSVDRLIVSENNYELFYIAMVPVFTEYPYKKTVGVLFVAQQVSSKYSFQEIIHEASQSVKKSSAFKFRVQKSLDFKKFKKNIKNEEDFYFTEKMHGITYRSKPVILLNFFDEPVGYLVVSLSQELERIMYQRKFIILFCILGLGAMFIFIFAAWFNNAFIKPFNTITEGFKDISQGNYEKKEFPNKLPADIQKTVSSFNQMVEELSEKEKMRRSFVSTLSHDLRTPLLAQRRVLELFQDEDNFQDEFKKLSIGLGENNEHLLSMVNMLLETFQYEEGKFQLQIKKINLSNLIEDCFNIVRPIADKKRIQLKNIVSKEIYLEIDPAQMKRVFINIIGNAIENIADESFVQIFAKEHDHTRCLIQIKDNGIGISETDLPNIFDRYYSVSGGKIRKKLGSGLGLYISKMIVEEHHGIITVDSIPNQETVFSIDLPLKRTPRLSPLP